MLVFRCARTGLYYPADFVENWGKTYGIGLGIRPVSESLINDYLQPICKSRDNSRTMHPVGYSYSQVDLVEVADEEIELNSAIVELSDPMMMKRSTVMRERQIIHCQDMGHAYPSEKVEIVERDNEKKARVSEIRNKFRDVLALYRAQNQDKA
jgi:hypothetical protein